MLRPDWASKNTHFPSLSNVSPEPIPSKDGFRSKPLAKLLARQYIPLKRDIVTSGPLEDLKVVVFCLFAPKILRYPNLFPLTVLIYP